MEIQPNREDIEKAVGWHKLVYSLFSDPNKSTLDNIGTRWAVHDLKRWIRENEARKFKFFTLSAEHTDGSPVWPDRFGRETLDDIRDSQGPYMFSTQYLNLPRDPADAVFRPQWLRYFKFDDEIPDTDLLENVTIVDLAGWGDSKGIARNVICTLSMDTKHHIWVRRYDRGKFDPSQVIRLMEAHAKAYNSRVRVEEVQY